MLIYCSIILKTRNMKALKILTLLILVAGLTAQAQEKYTVTRISGKAINVKTGMEVKPGDILLPEDKITFDNFDSYIISINQSMGRFMLKLHEPPAPEGKQILTATVKDIAVPTKRRSLMTERFRPDEKEVTDLKSYFGSDKFSIIGDKVDINLNTSKYQLNDNKFIVFYYRVDNNPVSKKLAFEQNTLKIEKDNILSSTKGTISGNEIPNLAVYNYEKDTKTSEEITRFTLVFVDKETLKNEFNTILPILKRQKMGEADIKKYLIEYYFDFYGATDSKTIQDFVNEVVATAAI